MAYTVGFISQKGGVGKSTLARMLACEAAINGFNVKIADTDVQQGTSFHWMRRRVENGKEPSIRTELMKSVKAAIAEADQFDMYIFDGTPHASKETLQIAKASDLVVIPTKESRDDLDPAILLAHDLLDEGIPVSKIVFALSMVSGSRLEVDKARDYITRANYRVLDGEVPNKAGFGIAHDKGWAANEVPFPSLREKVDILAQSLIDAVSEAKQHEEAA